MGKNGGIGYQPERDMAILHQSLLVLYEDPVQQDRPDVPLAYIHYTR